MEFLKEYTVKDEHIDAQQIMDGLFYPFYMEYCRHDYIREVLGFDVMEEAEKGTLMVLSGYRIAFIRSLKKSDRFKVSCSLLSDSNRLSRIHFKQEIIMNNKIMTRAVFTGTCVPATGGRPFLPGAISEFLNDAPVFDGTKEL